METTITKMKQKDIKPLREKMLQEVCPLCLKSYEGKVACLDHCHITGLIRAPLCSWCNSQLGKMEGAAIRAVGKDNMLAFLERAIDYVKFHSENPSEYEHPTHGVKKKKKRKTRSKV